MRGVVLDVDHFAVHDGQGVRTCIYLKGCPLRCGWCHSPESQALGPEIIYIKSRCRYCGLCAAACPSGSIDVGPGRHEQSRESCRNCQSCSGACPTGALSVCGIWREAKDVAREALEDAVFYRHSGGGVTLSGGEALMQQDFTLETARLIMEGGAPLIVETSGYGDGSALFELADAGAEFYYDIKLLDPEAHQRHCGASNALILKNLEALRGRTDRITLRTPLIPSITDTEENISGLFALAASLGLRHVHLLPYNASAPAKYEWLRKPYPLTGISQSGGLSWGDILRMAPEPLIVSVIE